MIVACFYFPWADASFWSMIRRNHILLNAAWRNNFRVPKLTCFPRVTAVLGLDLTSVHYPENGYVKVGVPEFYGNLLSDIALHSVKTTTTASGLTLDLLS